MRSGREIDGCPSPAVLNQARQHLLDGNSGGSLVPTHFDSMP
jgi:hypothetical protein